MARFSVFVLLAFAMHAVAGDRTPREGARSERRDRGRPASCAACDREGSGRIVRSASAVRAFRLAHPCPATKLTAGACPGYVVDHIKALKRGGADTANNMQWQTTAEALAKDRVE